MSFSRNMAVALAVVITAVLVMPASTTVIASRASSSIATTTSQPAVVQPPFVNDTGFTNLSNSYICAPGQAIRKCSSFEGLHGGLTLVPDENLEADLPCYCPGHGPVTKRFTFAITKDQVPNLLVPGTTRTVVQMNGSSPGPTIVVNEHDWVTVQVFNHMEVDGAAVHWHGMIMQGTPYSDGVTSLTQCTIPPGGNVMYTFRASHSGTYWYHGHYIEQYVNGLIGPLIINRIFPDGQTEKERYGYTSDITLMIQDLHNNEAHSLVTDYFLTPNSTGNEPIPDAIAVNGKLSGMLSLTASRNETTRLRFVAANALSMFNISIDGVKLSIIETDGTSTKHTPVSSFVLNVAQRVSVTVDWATVPASVDSVYLRISALTDMFPVNITDYVPWYDVPGAKPLNPNFLGIVQFQDGDIIKPTYSGVLQCPHAPTPVDSNLLIAVPDDPKYAPDPTHFMYTEVNFFEGPDGVNYAGFNNITSTLTGLPDLNAYLSLRGPPAGGNFNISSADASPIQTKLIPINHDVNGRYLLPYKSVVDVIINNTDDGGHPMHLHGHAFWIIASSEWPEAEQVNRANYPRRDVVTVPANGSVRIRFIADNPGIWAYHCHIDWHMAAGLLATFIEAPDELRASGATVPNDFLKLCQGSDQVSKQDRYWFYPNVGSQNRIIDTVLRSVQMR
jgi:FtsP/CotA-like multicopper oxidase with cupredoxin domain